MRDLYHNISVTQPLNPINSTTAKTSAAIDRQGFETTAVIFSIGLAGDTLSGAVYWTLKLQHSDVDSGYVDVAGGDVVGGSPTVVVDSMAKDETAYKIGYIGGKRYVKAVATPTGTHSSGTPIGMLVLRGAAAYLPVS